MGVGMGTGIGIRIGMGVMMDEGVAAEIWVIVVGPLPKVVCTPKQAILVANTQGQPQAWDGMHHPNQ